MLKALQPAVVQAKQLGRIVIQAVTPASSHKRYYRREHGQENCPLRQEMRPERHEEGRNQGK
jgi:hypothetical protein